ncbi:hypothetical protein GMDG_01865 [Pseudogymnoascus destructans 20631-21]|uniref:Uncharacterized protein n=2 Tax=Pseudogymnoascus destructans TaxID=655981 RepID=L8FY49_PSED2|nr:hypothetical protein GMDG_01865 [Pseudogymnoascus destructans 20631-21]
MTPGWTSTVKNDVKRQPESRKTHRRKAGAITQAAERSMVYTCDRCKRKTRHVITTTALPRINPRRAEQSSLVSGEAPERLTSTPQSQAGTPTMPSANASSRKRAKSRKQGGLQALLAKNKEASQSSSGGFGLDLWDLMNNG